MNTLLGGQINLKYPGLVSILMYDLYVFKEFIYPLCECSLQIKIKS